MAEPAWVLRVRRARVRHTRSHGTSLFWSLRALVLARRFGSFLPAWLVLLLRRPLLGLLPLIDTRPALRAADTARAVLNGLSPRDTQVWQQRLTQRRVARRRWYRLLNMRAPSAVVPRFPLRYAAHVITIGVVSLVVWAGGASAGAGILRLDVDTRPLATQIEGGDQVVEWAPSSEAQARDDVLAQPVLRNPQAQFEPAFVTTHELSEGETLGGLASQYRVSVASLFWANDLDRGGVLAAGQELRIPRISGIPYVIKPDDTLESIAEQFQVATRTIVLFKANGLKDDQPLPVSREIFIAGGVLPYPAEIVARYGDEQAIASMVAVAAGVVREAETNLRTGPSRSYPRVGYLDAGYRLKLTARHGDWVKVDSGASGAGWVRADLIGLSAAALAALAETNDFPPPPPRWVWPTRGEITSRFGWRSIPYRSFHDGVDIANAAGTRIYAARGGRVIEAGWCSGFGYCVKIDHGDGVVTIYGHMLKKPPVRVGNAVDVGDLIGYMGSTFDRRGGGYSTGVHLHFTVKVNGKVVNPLKFLP